jgi:16S rRNA (guanine966-N2)-methyltransferase
MPEHANRIRIIGGCWRGRRLSFPAVTGLRPTPDRVRETLFNWLSPVINGARCLDLFAGSGALGIEALSRGAADVVFVEQHPQVVRALYQNLKILQIAQPQIECADARRWLADQGKPFDIVLLDPPFGSALLNPVCRSLEQHGWLTENAWVYLEMEHGLVPELPTVWQPVRKKNAGQVDYWLMQRQKVD